MAAAMFLSLFAAMSPLTAMADSSAGVIDLDGFDFGNDETTYEAGWTYTADTKTFEIQDDVEVTGTAADLDAGITFDIADGKTVTFTGVLTGDVVGALITVEGDGGFTVGNGGIISNASGSAFASGTKSSYNRYGLVNDVVSCSVEGNVTIPSDIIINIESLTSFYKITIASGAELIITGRMTNVAGLVINSGGKLTIKSGAKLDNNYDIINNGTFTVESGGLLDNESGEIDGSVIGSADDIIYNLTYDGVNRVIPETAKYGETLNAVKTGLKANPSTPEFTASLTYYYKWSVVGDGDLKQGILIDIPGETSSAYEIQADDVGKTLAVSIRAEAEGVENFGGKFFGYIPRIFVVEISKADGAAITTDPALVSKTATSVTLSAAVLATNPGNQTVEYSCNTLVSVPEEGWQTERVFTGLTPGETYYFCARSKATDTYAAGEPTYSFSVTTLGEPPGGGTQPGGTQPGGNTPGGNTPGDNTPPGGNDRSPSPSSSSSTSSSSTQPAPAPAPTTTDPAPSEPDPASPAADFITRLYQNAFGRTPSAEELAHWQGIIDSGVMSGADVAKEFYLGAEMTSKNLSDSEFIDALYSGLLGRAPDAAGKDAWLALMTSGLSRENILAQFIASAEFTGLCSSLGITL